MGSGTQHRTIFHHWEAWAWDWLFGELGRCAHAGMVHDSCISYGLGLGVSQGVLVGTLFLSFIAGYLFGETGWANDHVNCFNNRHS